MTDDAPVPAAKPRLAVLTGAGVSAPSGLPVYRGGDGMWDRDPELAQITTASRWYGKAEQAWNHWNGLRRAALLAQPNPAHRALAAAESWFDVHVTTQNIDGLHTAAGSTGVTELHGGLFRSRCSRRACHARHGAWPDREVHDTVPTCPHCGRIARADVILFGESVPAKKLRGSVDAARKADVWMAIGTSGTVFPAAGLIDHSRRDAFRVLVNAEPWPGNTAAFDREVLGDAAEMLADLLQDLYAEQRQGRRDRTVSPR
ncbi:NAD-dependent protein deacetylase [Yinghuangia aomiensis]|uniref:protein acetyllysine N-acetyltransferase n=1 Tax=Yinghuangia aomiensis TaxID=676205 RepID=A0ABP9I5G5_9ACTN